MRLVWLPFATDDGPGNMARDRILGELARVEDPPAVFGRLYAWSDPTLSLGYFQSIASVETDPRWRGIAVTRRETGGGAIVHDREITYALAFPAAHPWYRRHLAAYEAVHEAVVERLRGISPWIQRADPSRERPRVGLRTGTGAAVAVKEKPFLCFQDRDPNDVVWGPNKILGSAQRRSRGVLLQHGSFLLRASVRAPELPGWFDLLDASSPSQSQSQPILPTLPDVGVERSTEFAVAAGQSEAPGDWVPWWRALLTQLLQLPEEDRSWDRVRSQGHDWEPLRDAFRQSDWVRKFETKQPDGTITS